jgi:hypothetical protein
MLLAKFAYNNSMTSAHQMMPFYANYGYHTSAGTAPTETNILSVRSVTYRHRIFALLEDCKTEPEKLSEQIKKCTDQHVETGIDFRRIGGH